MSQEIQSIGNLIKGTGRKIPGNLGVKQKVVKNQIKRLETAASSALRRTSDPAELRGHSGTFAIF